ncbi:MAG TPA: tlde1 domain-containing protein [Pirellulaceae bacterium]|nr:tlde1 domain-containing protein [Pirellulaceae bacterium]
MPMKFTGQQLVWDGVGAWNATSGMPGHQNSLEQHLSDKGPIPEGEYYVPLALGGNAKVTTYKKKPDGSISEAKLDTRAAIESLQCIAMPGSPTEVLIFENWGSNRVRLQKVKVKHRKAAHRDGFYLHDSTKGFSHGCIEIDTSFFSSLRAYAAKNGKTSKVVKLIVDYGPDALTKGVSTLGSTKKSSTAVQVKCD